jgi:hypothetical protein
MVFTTKQTEPRWQYHITYYINDAWTSKPFKIYGKTGVIQAPNKEAAERKLFAMYIEKESLLKRLYGDSLGKSFSLSEFTSKSTRLYDSTES